MAKIEKIIKAFGIKKLNELQEESIPVIISGENVIIVAPTGSGKTEAAMIPVFYNILKNGGRCLYITPLRALNRDMFRRLIKAGEKLGIRVDLRHGDTPQRERRKQVKNPPDVLITTPETFQILFFGEKIKKMLEDVKYVIIDEVHEMIGSKRGVQLSLGLERLKEIAGRFQRILLSATVKKPKEYAEYFMGGERFQVIEKKMKKEYEINIYYPKIEEIDKELSKILLVTPKVAWSIRKIKEIAEKTKGSILLFTNTRETAEMLSSRLKKAFPDLGIEIHHSSLSREVREKHEKMLREGKLKILVATSSMELGIDIGYIERVIQYMSPRQVKRLVQRVGRSGHKIERKSIGDIITIDFDDYTESLAIKELMKEGYIEGEDIHKNALDVLAHQISGIVIDFGEIELKKLLEIIRRSKYYENLDINDLVEVLEFMERIGIIRIWKNKIRKGKRVKLYYIENVSMIPDEKSFLVIDIESNTLIGILHEDFVMRYCDIGSLIVIKGEVWRIKDIKGTKIYVVQEEGEGEIPAWEGELIPVYKEVSEKAYEFKRILFKKFYKKGWIPKNYELVIEHDGNYVILNYPFGSKVSECVGRILAKRIGDKFGRDIKIKMDPYRIVLEVYDPEIVLKELKKGFRMEDLIEGIKRTKIYLSRMLHVGRRFGVFSKNMEYSLSYIKKAIKSLEGTPVEKEAINEILIEKMDVEGAKNFFENIINEKIKIKLYKGISDMTKESTISLGEIYISRSDYVKLVKERLENTELIGYCINESRIIFKKKLKEIDYFNCPKCKSPLAIVKERDLEDLDKLDFSRELIDLYGKESLYLIASMVPWNKKREILMKFHGNLEKIIKEIIKEERRVVRAILKKKG